jgi:murein L,D-transpeptidase YcbB/YkuD
MKLKFKFLLGIQLMLSLELIAQKIDLPNNSFYIQLNEHQKKYLQIAKLGGFPFIRMPQKHYVINDSSKNIYSLKKYLLLSNDLLVNDNTKFFTQKLFDAIMHYQVRMGLHANGKIDAATRKEMNTSIAVRLTQMEINLQRMRLIKHTLNNNYIVINIPEFKLHIVEDNVSLYDANVVVGKAGTQTLVFKDSISSVVLNPYWNIPSSIIYKEILPKIFRNKNYLVENNMEMLSDSPPIIRQVPGNTNSLGKMKFLFPNSHNIYLHDTPEKYLFKNYKRALSHGCIRVENPKVVAIYLLRNSKQWNASAIDSVLISNVETPIQLAPKVPIYIVYFTAWVNFKGELNFRKDVYKKDKIFVK